MKRRALLTATLLSCFGATVGLIACGGSDDEAEIDTTPIVGLYELPISRNAQPSAPTDATRVEINQRELRVNSVKVLDLVRGRPADTEVADHVLTKLQQQLRAAPARARASIKVEASVPYLTLAETLHTLKSTGMNEVHFAVRTLGETPAEAWMPIRNFRVVPHEGEIPWSTRALPWSAFTDHWRPVYEACRAGEYVDCDAPYANLAQGGELEMELWTRGQAMKVTFSQVNAPVPEEGAEGGGGGGGVAMIEGVAPAAPAGDEEPTTPPATMGAFTLRHQESVQADSALSAMVAPVCANQACRAIVDTDASALSMRVLSMIGAVFPTGTTEPEITFRLPAD